MGIDADIDFMFEIWVILSIKRKYLSTAAVETSSLRMKCNNFRERVSWMKQLFANELVSWTYYTQYSTHWFNTDRLNLNWNALEWLRFQYICRNILRNPFRSLLSGGKAFRKPDKNKCVSIKNKTNIIKLSLSYA